ncbi:MAG: hypothetical protein JWQ35_937 [Bacteriovoracaceae bacterium]|nr:hypothetical protein [Bacteriovoracaceae bacterium]
MTCEILTQCIMKKPSLLAKFWIRVLKVASSGVRSPKILVGLQFVLYSRQSNRLYEDEKIPEYIA